MELRLDSLTEDVPQKSTESFHFVDETAKKEVPVFRYFTREGLILPSNERTLKKQMDKEAEEEIKRLRLESQKKAEYEQKLRLLELNNEKKKRKEEEELMKKTAERRVHEEAELLEKMVFSSERKLCQAPPQHLSLPDKDDVQFGGRRFFPGGNPADF